MKAWSQILVITLFLANSSCNYLKKKKPTPTKPPITTYFISNWADYEIPSQISVESLKSVLDLIAKYQDELYCPFGKFEICDEKSLKEIVNKIILDILTAEKLKKKDMGAVTVCNLNKSEEISPAMRIGMCLASTNMLRKISKLRKKLKKRSNENLNEITKLNDDTKHDHEGEELHEGRSLNKHYAHHMKDESLIDSQVKNNAPIQAMELQYKHLGVKNRPNKLIDLRYFLGH